jgi:hypothetical protein
VSWDLDRPRAQVVPSPHRAPIPSSRARRLDKPQLWEAAWRTPMDQALTSPTGTAGAPSGHDLLSGSLPRSRRRRGAAAWTRCCGCTQRRAQRAACCRRSSRARWHTGHDRRPDLLPRRASRPVRGDLRGSGHAARSADAEPHPVHGGLLRGERRGGRGNWALPKELADFDGDPARPARSRRAVTAGACASRRPLRRAGCR